MSLLRKILLLNNAGTFLRSSCTSCSCSQVLLLRSAWPFRTSVRPQVRRVCVDLRWISQARGRRKTFRALQSSPGRWGGAPTETRMCSVHTLPQRPTTDSAGSPLTITKARGTTNVHTHAPPPTPPRKNDKREGNVLVTPQISRKPYSTDEGGCALQYKEGSGLPGRQTTVEELRRGN